MSERKMAWVAKIDLVETHPDADLLDIATIGGWKCVTKRNEFKTGDLAIYFSIDSWIPSTIAPFLTKGIAARVYNEVSGERLRTVKLRGVVSQGLLLPVSCVPDQTLVLNEGDDLSEVLNIQKWERADVLNLAGNALGLFPSFIYKTNQERVQNLSREIKKWADEDLTFEVTEKCEGSSCTVFFNNEEFGVCSRNLQLKETEGNTFWETALMYDLRLKMTALNRNIAVQAELIGPGIQNNIYKLDKFQLKVFDIFDIDTLSYLSPEQRCELVTELGLPSAPVLDKAFRLPTENIMTALLTLAEGKSIIGNTKCQREGLVLKANNGTRTTFKVISNSYLLKHGD